jgi:hypothetical protein
MEMFNPLPKTEGCLAEGEPVSHFLGRLGRHEPEQPAHLVADRVALLLRQDQPGMGWTLRLQTAIVGDIETIENPSFPRRKGDVVLVLPLDHVRFVRGKQVQPSRPQRRDQGLVHGVLVEVEASIIGTLDGVPLSKRPVELTVGTDRIETKPDCQAAVVWMGPR